MSKEKILVVEDETIVAEDIKHCLEGLGYEVTATVATGEGALETIEKNGPNLVLMDIKLRGEMNGIEASHTIRERFGVPIIYLTAHSDDDTLERAKKTQPYGFVVKPFNERDLRTAIETALYKHQMEMKLRESEARFRSVVEVAKDAILSTNSNNIITFWNPAAERIFGYSKEEAIGNHLRLIIPERFHATLHVGMGTSIFNGKRTLQESHESIGSHKEAGEFPIELSVSHWDAKGETFFMFIIRDISDRKRVEAEREKLILELQEALSLREEKEPL